MNWIELIKNNRKKILETWFLRVIETYPEETAKFLKSQSNPFLNPVGGAIKEGLEGIINWVISNSPEAEKDVIPFLDKIIRIRAVQDFKPSDALSFISDFRNIVRECCKQLDKKPSYDFLEEFDAIVDRLLMASFNVFVKCREDLYEVRVQEVKNRTFRLLQRAGLLYEIAEPEKGSDDS